MPSLALTHSWPLFERGQRFDLGAAVDVALPAFQMGMDGDALAAQGIGLWDCELADSQLSWTTGVYDLFGLPRGAALSRPETVALYEEFSRARMERLRAYAIRHRRGFTLDAELRPASGGPRWMRLIAAPVCEGARVVRLHGIKQDVTPLYL
jgi:PAS domain-containing protein